MKNTVFAMLLMIAASFAIDAADVRYWNNGPLEWSDFTGTPVMATTPTYFSGRLDMRTKVDRNEKSKFNTEMLYSTYALAVMDKNKSYADSASRTSRQLRYHQLQFDMLEVVRRRLQADLNSGMAGIEADNRLRYYQRLYDEQVADLARQTENGHNDAKLQEYEYFTRKQLDEFSLPAVPEVQPGKFNYGWFIGTGALIPTGGISDVFKSTWVFNIGLTVGYDRFAVKADISYGQSAFKNRRAELFGTAGEWAINSYANQLSGSVSVGFRVVDAKHFSLTPHIGGGWGNYGWNIADFEKEPDTGTYRIASDVRKISVRDFNFMAGIDFDWHFHTVVSDKPFFLSGRREQYVSSLRLTPYVMRQCYSKFTPERAGYQVGVMLSYVGIARALGIK